MLSDFIPRHFYFILISTRLFLKAGRYQISIFFFVVRFAEIFMLANILRRMDTKIYSSLNGRRVRFFVFLANR